MEQLKETSNVASGEDEAMIIAQNEQYAKDALLRSNYKKVAGISRVTVRRMDNQLVIIENPEVYKSNSNTYIVFGDPLVDNFGQKLVVAQQQARQSALLPSYKDGKEVMKFNPKDIELILKQTECSREEAVRILRRNHGDVVNSIFEICQSKSH